MIKCFFIKPTGKAIYSLRRFVFSKGNSKCSHNASVSIGTFKTQYTGKEKNGRKFVASIDPHSYKDNKAWPIKCKKCGYKFEVGDEWQVNQSELYSDGVNPPTILKEAPVGAMWDAWWFGDYFKGEDDIHLMVRTPGGDWCVDSRASNCTMKDDNKHKCWVRHGTVPNITVDKKGNTCKAGAGSIQCGSYHGFLRGGHLT